jgi:hypothetical protein
MTPRAQRVAPHIEAVTGQRLGEPDDDVRRTGYGAEKQT